MYTRILLLVSLGLAVIISNCAQQNVDIEEEKKALFAEIEKCDQAFQEGDVEKALEYIGESFYLVYNGIIENRKKEDQMIKKNNQLNELRESKQTVERKLVSRLLNISGDGKMAWGIFKYDITIHDDSSKNQKEIKYTNVHLMIFEKMGSVWILKANAPSQKKYDI